MRRNLKGNVEIGIDGETKDLKELRWWYMKKHQYVLLFDLTRVGTYYSVQSDTVLQVRN
jgi:hypothetical protein